jgi:hypothetical protein
MTTKVTTIALEEAMHWRLRQLALAQRTNLRALIRRIVAEYVASQDDEAR